MRSVFSQNREWQREFDDNVTSPAEPSDTWWALQTQADIEITEALQASLGSNVAIKLQSRKGWLIPEKVERPKG